MDATVTVQRELPENFFSVVNELVIELEAISMYLIKVHGGVETFLNRRIDEVAGTLRHVCFPDREAFNDFSDMGEGCLRADRWLRQLVSDV